MKWTFDSMEDAVADALEEEDTDEFLRRLGRIARGAAPDSAPCRTSGRPDCENVAPRRQRHPAFRKRRRLAASPGC